MDGRGYANKKMRKNIDKLLESLPVYMTEYYNNMFRMEPTYCFSELTKLSCFLAYVNSNKKDVTIEDMSSNALSFLNSKDYYESSSGETKETKKSYLYGLYGTLNRFFEYCESKKMISVNPLKDTKINLKIKYVRDPALTSEQIKELNKQVKEGAGSDRAKAVQKEWRERDVLIISLINATGARRSAVCNLNIQNINLEEQKIIIRDKNDSPNEYYISSIMPYLVDWLKKRDEIINHWKEKGVVLSEEDKDALFVTKKRKRMTAQALYYVVEKYTKEAFNKGYSPHKLRAAFGTILYEQTKDINYVKEAMKHSSASTTGIYIRPNENSAKKTDKIMGEILFS